MSPESNSPSPVQSPSCHRAASPVSFRTLIADRLTFTLINRRQVSPNGFSTDPGGAVTLDDRTRRTVLKAYQERKRDEVQHPVSGESMTVGLLPHVQSRLLARTLRGDLPEYPALVLR